MQPGGSESAHRRPVAGRFLAIRSAIPIILSASALLAAMATPCIAQPPATQAATPAAKPAVQTKDGARSSRATPSNRATSAAEAPAQDTPFYLTHNGGFYHYVRESRVPFRGLQSQIESGYYARRGIRTLAIYCPYRASHEWRGVPAIDHFSTNPANGTVEDFRALVTAAHAHGMAVVVYVGLLFVDEHNPIWLKAQRDHREGRQTPAENTFLFEGDPGFVHRPPANGARAHSELAQSDYATSWQRPAINFGHPAGRAYARSVIRFWLDLGVDGFEYDSPEQAWGARQEHLRAVLVATPGSHGKKAKYTIAEGASAEFHNARSSDEIGYSHILLSEDDDEASVATHAINGGSIDTLERHFKRYLDGRRRQGKGAKSVSTYTLADPRKRALEAALLTGNGAYVEIDYDEVYSKLDRSAQARYDAVFRALARTSSEAPGAARKRLPVIGGRGRHYAVLRVSPTGKQRAINIYNLSNEPATVSVQLAGSGIAEGAVPVDLLTGDQGPPVAGRRYTVALPPYGFTFLRFGPAEPVP